MSKNYGGPSLDNFQVYSVLSKNKTKLDGIFCLNPPAINVSFYSQQRRAVFVAEKIAEQHPNERVLIVGGGLSGTTCYFALRALGQESVFLFEAGRKNIWCQSDAYHRFAHPSLAEWPKSDRSFSAATNLPLMNWHAGQMNECVEMIRDDPALKCANELWSDNIYFHTVVTKLHEVTPSADAKKVWQAQTKLYEDNNNSSHPNDFGIVILATGFGTEIEAPFTNTEYWQFDIVNKIRQDPRKYGNLTPVVIGGGDAALIDTARLCIGETAEELSCRLIYDLRHDNHKAFHNGVVSEPSLSTLEDEVTKAYADKNMANGLSKVPQNCDSIEGITKAAKKENSGGRSKVLLVCPTDPNTNPKESAAVNVLLFSILRRNSDKGRVELNWEDGKADCGKRIVTIKDVDRSFHDPDYVFIFRCGSNSDWPIFEGGDDQTIEVGDSDNSNYGGDILNKTALKITQGILGNHREYENLDIHEIDDKYRFNLVKRYAQKVLGVSEKETKKIPFEIGGIKGERIVTIPVSFKKDLEKSKKIGGVDYTAFGIKLRYKDTDDRSTTPEHTFVSDDINTGNAA